MPPKLRPFQWVALIPLLGCGALADSPHRRSPGGVGEVCASDGDCSDATCLAGVCAAAGADLDALETDATPGASAAAPGSESARGMGRCGPDAVFSGSIEIRDQATLNQLMDCERLDGILTLYLFPGIDETPLLSLRDVNGGISIYGSTEPVANPLAGFAALEEATHLLLQGLTLTDLRPLGRLQHIGAETSPLYSVPIDITEGGYIGGLEILSCPGLQSLRGLGALESVRGIVLADNPDLVLLEGLEQLASLPLLSSMNCPLLDLAGLDGLGIQRLEIGSSAIRDLSGLGDARALQSLRLEWNEDLRSLQGAQLPAILATIDLIENPSLLDLTGLEGLRDVGAIAISSSLSSSGLQSLSGLEGLTTIQSLQIRGQSQLRDLSGLAALRFAGELSLHENAGLVNLQGLSNAQSIETLTLSSVPQFTSFSGLGSPYIALLLAQDIARLDLTGLERATINSLTLAGVEQLSAPGGLPTLDPRGTLTIQQSPALRDLRALAPLEAIGTLALNGTAVENLDALSNLKELLTLTLWANPALQQIDALADVAKLEALFIQSNPALLRLPVFTQTACDTCADFGLELMNNVSLQSGPGLPNVTHASAVNVQGNQALTSLAGLSSLRFVGSLRVERNPSLSDLALPQLEQAGTLVIHGNPVLDDAPLAALQQLPGAETVRILSNLSGPARLDPCPWTNDAVCDEAIGDCAVGSDSADCGPLQP